MNARAPLLLLLLVCTLTACGSDRTHRQPAWLTSALASDRLGGLTQDVITQAAADPDHIAALRAAVRAPDPDNPRAAKEASNLSHLVIQLSYKHDNSPEYLALARRMYAADPEHHGYTLAAIAARQPFEACEAEVLRVAFDPRSTASPAWQRSRALAASTLVQRLALDVPRLPRRPPADAPAFSVADGREITCFHWTLRAAYGQGPEGEAINKVAAILDNPESPHYPVNDHDAENCRTVIWRLTSPRDQQP